MHHVCRLYQRDIHHHVTLCGMSTAPTSYLDCRSKVEGQQRAGSLTRDALSELTTDQVRSRTIFLESWC